MVKLKSLFGILISLFLITPAFAIPGIPHQFYGDVMINGAPAPDGSTVTAKIDGVEVASTTTSEGRYGYEPIFYVEDPDGSPANTRAGKTINFFINGIDTGATAIFANGETTELDLSITTGGGSPGGGGGGGGSSGGGGSKTTETTTTTQPEEVVPGPGSPPEEPKTNIIPDTGTTATTLPSLSLVGFFSLDSPLLIVGLLLIAVGVLILLYFWKIKKK